MFTTESTSDTLHEEEIIAEYLGYIDAKEFPCVAAKAALSKQQVKCMVATHISCPHDDSAILEFLYNFIDEYRSSAQFYHTAAIIFKVPGYLNEATFDDMLWNRLQSLSDLDAENYLYDARVSADPSSSKFSFSIKGEAFYIIGLHPDSSRGSRQFKYATIVFNPHDQFEKLRETTKYNNLKGVVRKRDIAYSGSINPMLDDFGDESEVYQYSGRQYDQSWQCPLKINHATVEHYSTS